MADINLNALDGPVAMLERDDGGASILGAVGKLAHGHKK
jgi:hypothetical protein